MRDVRYRRRPELRTQNPQQALEFIDDVGFCFLFPDHGVEMPNLWHAIAGSKRDIPHHHHDRDLGRAWDWKDELPVQGLVYYGKLLRRKPMFISLRLLPSFYALSENYGDVDDYITEYEDGKLSYEARQVLEALLEHGAQPTSHLRRYAGLAGKANAPRFDRAIVELQEGLKIIKVGVSDANAWKYCYVYDLLVRRWPELPDQAQSISRRQARRTLVANYLDVVVTASREMVQRVFRLLNWTAGEYEETFDDLLAEGAMQPVTVAGLRREQLASCAALCRLDSARSGATAPQGAAQP